MASKILDFGILEGGQGGGSDPDEGTRGVVGNRGDTVAGL